MAEPNYGFLYGGLAAGANLLGGAVVAGRHECDARFLRATLAIGSGFMLAATLLDIIPASLEAGGPWLPGVILCGYLLVHLAQRVFQPHVHGPGEAHHGCDPQAVHLLPEVGLSAVVGLVIHAFFDGVAIGAGFNVSSALGLLIFMAVILHKTPEGLTLASIVLAATGRRWLAIGAAALLGLATLIGVLLAGSLAVRFQHAALALSGGVTLYVVASDLIPEVTSGPGWHSLALLFAGVALYGVTDHLLRAAGLP